MPYYPENTDFRSIPNGHPAPVCPFCLGGDARDVLFENDLTYAILDKHPVTEGHSLVIPKRHVPDAFDMTGAEWSAVRDLLRVRKRALSEEDPTIAGFNVGFNSGVAAGQTIAHCHVHLIPRRVGDVENPRGGVRGAIPDKRIY